jgi:hypothetical protein
MRSLLPCTDSTSRRPQPPRPMIPMFSMFVGLPHVLAEDRAN